MQRSFEHYIFDFDGTIVDSVTAWGEATAQAIESYGLPYSEDLLRTIGPMDMETRCKYFVLLGNKASWKEVARRICDDMTQYYRDGCPMKDGVSETLAELKKRGKAVSVLTATDHELFDPKLQQMEIAHLLDHAWCSTDFGFEKSDPRLYRNVARALHLPISSILFVDDNINSVRGAVSAGVFTVGMYDAGGAAVWPQMQATADRTIMAMKELLEI